MNGQEMPKYLGVKLVHAIEMSKAQFTNQIKNEDWPHNGDDEDGYLVVYEDGYKSWSPKQVFEKAYRELKQTTVQTLFRNIDVFLHDGSWRFTLQDEINTTGENPNSCAVKSEPSLVERLISERNELTNKIHKLVEFTGTNKFISLSENSRRLLLAQRDAMNTYLRILELRMLEICPDEIVASDYKQINIDVNVSEKERTDSDEMNVKLSFPNFKAGSLIIIKSDYRYLVGLLDEDSNYQVFHLAWCVDLNKRMFKENVGIILSAQHECIPGIVKLAEKDAPEMVLALECMDALGIEVKNL